MAKKPKPGPYHSALNEHLAEIAALRNTEPFPTPYSKIAEILHTKYGLTISANSIWSFVRTRTPGRGRKLKYKLPKDLAKGSDPSVTNPAQPTPMREGPAQSAASSEQPSTPGTSEAAKAAAPTSNKPITEMTPDEAEAEFKRRAEEQRQQRPGFTFLEDDDEKTNT